MSAPRRRRLYVMRHAEVRYFGGVHPDAVVLTERGREQARAAAEALASVTFDRAITSGLARTVETAGIVAPAVEPETREALREVESGELRGVDANAVQEMMTDAFRGAVPAGRRFLGGETIGELVARVNDELDRLLAEPAWDIGLLVLHGGVNRAILSRAVTGERVFLGGFEQSPGCINVLDAAADGSFVVRAVNHTPYDPVHARGPRLTTMEQLWLDYLDARDENP